MEDNAYTTTSILGMVTNNGKTSQPFHCGYTSIQSCSVQCHHENVL